MFLRDRSVIDNILNFEARNITPSIRKEVEDTITKNSSSFDRRNADRASAAAGPLCDWVIANVKFSKVLETVKPLEEEMNKLLRAL